MSLVEHPMKANSMRLYFKEDGSSQEDSYFGSNLKDVYFQTWGNESPKYNKWIYKDHRGELTHVIQDNLPAGIKMALMLMEDL